MKFCVPFSRSPKNLNQSGFDHVLVAVFCIVVAALVGTAMLVAGHAATAVQWKGVLEAFNSGSNYCLTANGSAASSKVVLDPCKASDNNQVWSLTDVKTATVLGAAGVQEFYLQNGAGTNECLNNPYGSKTNGATMQLYTCKTTDAASIWVWGARMTSRGLSSHQLINLASISGSKGLCLDDAYGAKTAGTKTQVYACKTTGQSNQSWFEDSVPTSSGGGSGSSSTAPAMPATAPSGFTRAFSEDFNTSAALGSFDSVYGSQFGEYSGCCSTNKFTQYSSAKVLYVQNGSMYYKLHSEGSTSYAAAPQPWGEKSFTYGQYGMSVKLDSTTGPGYKIAFLLWPATNEWSNEVDFPEVDPDFTAPVRAASLNYSPNGSGENGFDTAQDSLDTGVHLTDGKYHTFLLTWTPGKMVATIDGKTVATFTGSAVPSQAMRLSLQAEGWINQGSIPTSTTDVLEVPYVFINTYK